MCDDHWLARYRCDYSPITLQRCQWEELGGETRLYQNGDFLENASMLGLTVSPLISTPYGFYRNNTSVFINTAQMNFLEGTNYNFSCVPVGVPSRPGDDFHFVEAVTLNPMPRLIACKQLIRVPFNVSSLVSNFCGMVSTVLDLESGAIGLQAVSGDCTVRIGQSMPDGRNESYLVRLSTGSYRFMKGLNGIACKENGEGLYSNCTSDLELGELKPKEQGYDVGKEVIVDSGKSAGAQSMSFSNPFKDMFKSNLKNTIIIIVVVVVVIVVVIIGLVILWKCCKKKKDGSGGVVTLVSPPSH
jgi:hypothetical protein